MSDKLGPYDLDSIYAGECSRLMASLPDGCIDLTVTSPPYDNLRIYNGYEFNFEAIAQQLWRVTKAGGVVVWVVGDATIDGSETGTSFRQALYFMGLGFNLETMIYEKGNTGANGPNYLYIQSFELCFVLSKGRLITSNLIRDRKNIGVNTQKTETALVHRRNQDGSKNDRRVITRNPYGVRTNIWHYSTGTAHDGDHPAPFPEALARDHILSWSNPGDLILDPMCGSGTTCKMAKENGRRWLGFDISPEYVELARRRVEGGRVPLFTLQSNGAINA